LAACPQVDILVNNAGGPPPGDFRDWDREAWMKALDANMLTPIELIKATVDGMAARGFGRIVNITSGAVKAPIDVLGLSNGARSGHRLRRRAGAQPRLASANVTINNLLPGVFDTDRIRTTMQAAAAGAGRAWRRCWRSAAPACRRRFGTSPEFGALRLPLQRAGGYLTGQNILLDGGAYPGTSDQRRRASDETTMPAAMSTNAAAWYQLGASPSSAADITPANTGVRLLKKAAMAGPTVDTPRPQAR
jgi:3-oxoacyl-[acyl-carrier protein] reductase